MLKYTLSIVIVFSTDSSVADKLRIPLKVVIILALGKRVFPINSICFYKPCMFCTLIHVFKCMFICVHQ